jgi:hypothetical protein
VIKGLLNTEITDLATLELLPLGATVIGDGAAWQRIIDGDWYVAGSDIGATSTELLDRGPLLVVWLPPEATR